MAKVLSSSRGTSPRGKADALPSAFVHYLDHSHTCAKVATVSFARDRHRRHIETLTADPLLGLGVSQTSLHSTGAGPLSSDVPTSAVPLVATWPQPAIAPRRSPRSGERVMRGELPQPKQVLLPVRCASSLAGHIATWLVVRHRHRNPSKNGATICDAAPAVKPATAKWGEMRARGAKWPFLGVKWQGKAKTGVNPSATSSYVVKT